MQGARFEIGLGNEDPTWCGQKTNKQTNKQKPNQTTDFRTFKKILFNVYGED